MFGGLFGPRQIDKSDVDRMRQVSPRRISFAYAHKNQPKRSSGPGYVGSFTVPFSETIGEIFQTDTDFQLYVSNYGGYWISIRSEEDFTAIEAWAQRQGTRVFLRDCLDLSVALDQNFTDNVNGQYTTVGALEARAKTAPDQDALNQLTDRFVAAIRDLPGYRNAPLIAAVPPRPDKSYDLPSALAQRISGALGITDLTQRFVYAGQKRTVKDCTVDEKWQAWQDAGLTLSPELEGAPDVILIDDKYQSGISLQFVASRLLAAGAGRIFGMCAVKTLGDDDNQ